ncbi:hypothetical protein BJY04DRAFT_219275 [Aspergillus karnatakaensis]|uniref:protein-arginine deiminase domain-containing protein n=1 Tax=Aspergillus karnatakaensis TaxID=1810916 RepID=UPI003CCC9FC0
MRSIPSFWLLADCLLLIHAVGVLPLTPDIRADTNRDGFVDLVGDSDVHSKATWSITRGAIFLPNVGDKHLRYSHEDLAGNPLSDNEFASCHDASGDLLIAPENIALLRTVPLPDIPDGASAHIYATPRTAYDRVRIFLPKDLENPNRMESWRLIDRQFNFNHTQLAAGLVLGIDGREFVKDSEKWDGHVTINFDVYETPGSETYVRDSVALNVAPVLTHHHLQRVNQIVTIDADETDPAQQYFVDQLESARRAAGLEAPVLLLNYSADIWAQDILEPAYASMPGPDGPVSIRIMLRSAQSTRVGGREITEQLRGPGVGFWQPGDAAGIGVTASGFGSHTINSYGNLETIPPYRSKSGVLYKAGRTIQGKHYQEYPAQSVRDLIFGQGVQDTLYLETGWLIVGHVDEFVQFLPFDNELGFTIAIASPQRALDILTNVQNKGHGDTPAVSFNPQPQMERFNISTPPEFLDLTVTDLLRNTSFISVNNYAQKWINHNLELLLSDIPLSRADIIEIPTLYYDQSQNTGGDYILRDGTNNASPPVLEGEYKVLAFLPGAINGIVSGKHYIAPDPFGPVVDGVDVIKRGVEEAYGRAGMCVLFIDNFFSHHNQAGQVHCASNTLRGVDGVGWE